MTGSGTLGWRTLHLFPLWGFAVAQPLYDLLARQSAFLSAHAINRTGLLVLAAALSLLGPALLSLLVIGARLSNTRTADALQSAISLLLIALTCAGIATQLSDGDVSWWAITAGGTLLVSMLYFATVAGMQIIFFLIPAALVFPLLFLSSASVRPWFSVSAAGPGVSWQMARTPHVVMVVFDELPTAALLNEKLEIDATRFPHFAALAQEALWYRNASTVATRTEQALPAILTGRHPLPGLPPEVSAYPENLFTMLAGDYQMHVEESVTRLCPPSICRSDRGSTAWSVAQDLSHVYAHLVAPPGVRSSLQPIDRGWKNFANATIAERADAINSAGRREHARAFISEIRKVSSPTLHFLHTNLPHAPYQYLPSGAVLFRHAPLSALTKRDGLDAWRDDERGVAEARHMFMWQLRFADTLLGELLERLRSQAMLEETLLIVTADHGVSLRPGELRRELTATNVDDILGVPLLIRDPSQDPRIVDDNVEIIDILTMIAKRLGAGTPSPGETHSHARKTVFTHAGRQSFSPALFTREPPAMRWHSPQSELVGRTLTHLAEREPVMLGDAHYQLMRPGLYQRVDPAVFVPGIVRGTVTHPDIETVLVVLNDRIAAQVQLSGDPPSARPFAAFVGERWYRRGDNVLHIVGLSRTAE